MFDRVTHEPNVLAGRATLRGLRISVARVVNLVANGMTPARIVAEYPDLEEEDVRQALGYAAAIEEDQVSASRRKVMRFLADAGISPRTVEFLRQHGHDAIHVRALGLQRASDPDSGRALTNDSSV
jgi:uncharacterized protein (DUF433 family)